MAIPALILALANRLCVDAQYDARHTGDRGGNHPGQLTHCSWSNALGETEPVEAPQALGCRHLCIIASHILPNVTAPIRIIASIWLGNDILIEATLSFVGLGTQPPTPSWGLMLSSTGRAFMEQPPWLAIFPGLAISLAVMGFNLFRHTLGDA